MSPEDREIMRATFAWSLLQAANEVRKERGLTPISADDLSPVASEATQRFVDTALRLWEQFPGSDFRETACYKQYKARMAH